MTDKKALLVLPVLARSQPSVDGSGKPQSLFTFRRWALTGLKINGQCVKLRTQWVGSRLCSSVEWLEDFHERCNAARSGEQVETTATVPASRTRSRAEADRILSEAGI